MKRRKAYVPLFAAALLLLAMVWLRHSSVVPAGQPPLLTLSTENFSRFAMAPDAPGSPPLLVLLFSPT